MRFTKTAYLRKLLLAALLLSFGLLAFYSQSSAQTSHPVSWSFFSRQLSPGVFEVHTIITVQEGWRFRNQTPVEVPPLVGQFVFLQHPNVLAVSKLKSERTVSGDSSCYYESNIRLVHLVRLKQLVSTNLIGDVSYTVCNDQLRRMLQDRVSFSILLK